MYSYEILHGAPQSIILGPLLFIIYLYPLAEVIKHHGFLYLFYADDTLLYCPYQTLNFNSKISELYLCTDDIKKWMSINKLTINDGKT